MSYLGHMDQVIRDMKNGVYDFTVDGKCSGCGNCCSNFLPISKKEIENIRRYIKKHHIREEIRRFPTVEQTVDMVCPFRSESEKKCTIYSVRPAICRDFQCDKPKKDIWADKKLYCGRYDVVDVRETFFGHGCGLFALLGQMMEGGTDD